MPPSAPGPSAPVTRPSALSTLWLVAFQQAHWALYRSIAIVLFGAYNGALAGLGLVIIEWLLSPFWRAGWTEPRTAQASAFDLALALTTTILFLLTGNLWVCAAVHALIALTLGVSRQESTQVGTRTNLAGVGLSRPAYGRDRTPTRRLPQANIPASCGFFCHLSNNCQPLSSVRER